MRDDNPNGCFLEAVRLLFIALVLTMLGRCLSAVALGEETSVALGRWNQPSQSPSPCPNCPNGQCGNGISATAPGGLVPWQPVQIGTQPTAPSEATKHPQVVRVTFSQGNRGSMGSGTITGRREDGALLVLTAWHVGDEGGSPKVTLYDGRQLAASLSNRDPASDLCELAISDPGGINPLPLSDESPKVGDRLWTMGYGPSGVFKSSQGKMVQAGTFTRTSIPVINSSCSVRQGDSGGPVVNENGHLVGIVTGGGQGDCVGADVPSLCFKWLERHRKHKQKSPSIGPVNDPRPPFSKPEVPPAPLPPNPSTELEAMNARLAALEAEIAKLKSQPIAPGVQGPAGPQGPQGAAGPAGKDGAVGPAPDTTKLVAAVVAALKAQPITIKTEDDNGNILSTVQAVVGDTLVLSAAPVK